MYLRHDGPDPVFVPEDGTRTRVTMMESVRDADPTKLKRGVSMLALPERIDALVREFLAGKLERCDRREKALIRFFLTKTNAARADGNPAGIYLSIRRGLKPNTFELFPNIRGGGCVEWLPRLNMDGTDALRRIFKEASPKTVTTVPDFMPAGSTEPGKGRMVPKVQMSLIPGRS